MQEVAIEATSMQGCDGNYESITCSYNYAL